MLSLNVTALGLVAFMCTFRQATEALRDDVLSSSVFKTCFAILVTADSGGSSILAAFDTWPKNSVIG